MEDDERDDSSERMDEPRAERARGFGAKRKGKRAVLRAASRRGSRTGARRHALGATSSLRRKARRGEL